MEAPTPKKRAPWWTVFIADGLSLLRAVFALFVLAFGWSEAWVPVIAAWTIGWLTDLLDGPAARRWKSLRNKYPKLDSDGLADSLLAYSGMIVVVRYSWVHAPSGWTVIAVELTLVTAILGGLMAAGLNDRQSPRTKRLIRWFMPLFHGVIQIGGVSLWFAYMAGGWLLVIPTVIVLALVAYMQRKKIKRWFRGEL